MPLAVSATIVSGRIALDVDERQHVLDVGVEQVALLDRAGAAATGVDPRSTSARISRRPVSSPTGLAPARQNFSPLYCLRVVARGEHDAGHVERSGREVQQVGRGESQVDDVGALRGRSLGDRGGQLGRAQPAVAPDHDARGARPPAKAAPMRRTRSGVEVVGHDAADVVRLEDAVEVGGHARMLRSAR